MHLVPLRKSGVTKALADECLLDLFGDTAVTHVQTTESDHCAIKIELIKSGTQQEPRRGKPFRYKNMWRRHPEYENIVAASWEGGCMSLSDVNASLGNLQTVLRQWDRTEFGSVRQELKRLRGRLEALHNQTIRRGPARKERDVAQRVAELLAREEVMEKQRSRVERLREGDRNTGFFQAKEKQRTRLNKITSLKRDDGSMCHSNTS
jgi:hypothetical protein